MKPTLFVRMMGGLGNQLFQYAFARSTALAMGAEVVMDPRYVWRKGHHTGLAIQAFNIQARLATPEELARFPEWTIKLSRGLRKWVRPTWNQYHELGLAYDPQAQSRKPGEMVSGFWQTERYFAHIRNTLLQELTLKEPLPPSAALMQKQILDNGTAVALHIRRGDYVTNPLAQKRHGVCSATYYEHAIDQLQNLDPHVHFFVFTDDIDWCQKFGCLADHRRVTLVQGMQPEHDLHLISCCQHQVISNSTFGWWGAWLNSKPQAMRIAPTPWHDDSALHSQAIIPNSWTTLAKH